MSGIAVTEDAVSPLPVAGCRLNPTTAPLPPCLPLAQQTSMSGIAVTEDAVNLFYLMRLKATVRIAGSLLLFCPLIGSRPFVLRSVLSATCILPHAPQGHGEAPLACGLSAPLCLSFVIRYLLFLSMRLKTAVRSMHTCFCPPAYVLPFTQPYLPPLPSTVQVGAVAGGRQRAVGGDCGGGRQAERLGRLFGGAARRGLPLRRWVGGSLVGQDAVGL